MKNTILLLSLLVFMVSCAGPDKKKSESDIDIKSSIETLETELFGSTANKIDRKKAIELIDLYVEYATKFPEDDLSPEYLYKAADISMNMKRPIQTIELFDLLMNKYPDFDKTPTVLFLKAFVYEDQMNDFDRAKKYYEEFLAKYPDNEFADDAEVSLKNLGKTPEELIKEFEEKGE